MLQPLNFIYRASGFSIQELFMKKIIVYALLLLACSTSLHAQESKPALLILDTAAVDVEESQSVII